MFIKCLGGRVTPWLVQLHVCQVPWWQSYTLACVVQVTLTGGAEHPAKIVGFDEDRDVAVLQLIIEDGDLVSITPPVCYTRVCSKRGFVCANQGLRAAADNLVMSNTESCFDQCQVVAASSKLPACKELDAGADQLSVTCTAGICCCSACHFQYVRTTSLCGKCIG